MKDSLSTAEDQFNERLAELRNAAPYRQYERVRSEVLRMKTREGPEGRPSAYWREELANIEYMLDASPLVIDRLRHHTLHVTGVRPYDYRSGADEKRERLADKLAALRDVGGDDLLVPEPPLLGGFGFEIDGVLINLDTLKFYEALIALERGGVLTDLRATAGRPVVVEIGPGWGGFAYQLKTLFPDVCYVLVDLPELFVFSGVYLLSAFPESRAAFWDDTRPLEPDALARHDFVFVPPVAFATVPLQRVDLALNIVSFQEMTTEQVRAYVERLFGLGCPTLYSLNRDRSAYNRELTSVRALIGERYQLDEVDVLPVPYTKLVSRDEMATLRGRERPRTSTATYRHVIGRLEPPDGEPASDRSASRSHRWHRLASALRQR